ncbi:hypothetical protein FPZ24_08075 [Sphingomonas panacisoli]|uniref:Uncharacterized protein n=1 Tax=Sphingomonas panacisoli TaxID=1813879 RepID=A0A5B8LK15_9SPHN|nr:hypothetical protein [Sphingomonas panacisoli]QDZ07440.1 hypothetical protein FPZ24_08075 [Sphingomonas panacisoli]
MTRSLVIKVLVGATIACLVLAIVSMTMCSRNQAGKSVVKASATNDAAKDAAADQRRTDDATILSNQQDRTDAINAAPKGETGPASRALNCQRWMRAHPGKAKPAAC